MLRAAVPAHPHRGRGDALAQAIEPAENQLCWPWEVALVGRSVGAAPEKAGGHMHDLDAGRLLGNVASSLPNQCGSLTDGLGESNSYVEWDEWLQRTACAGAKKGSCPPVKGSLAHQEAEKHMVSKQMLLQQTPLTWARRGGAVGCVCLVAAVSGDGLAGIGKPVPYWHYLLQKVPPLSGNSGFPYVERALERVKPSSRSTEKAGLAWGALAGARRRKRRAGVGGNANVALPLRQLQLRKGSWSSAACPYPASRQLQLLLLLWLWDLTQGMPGLGFPLSTPGPRQCNHTSPHTNVVCCRGDSQITDSAFLFYLFYFFYLEQSNCSRIKLLILLRGLYGGFYTPQTLT